MIRSLLLSCVVALILIPQPSQSAAPPSKGEKARPKVEVVFCLDTTGSMSGLLDGAKAKIWSMCNQIATGTPVPDLKVGLVAYRDKGDAYVTKVFDLTADLDAIHGHLKTFKAEGGGDFPEHVNQALYDAVHKIQWSSDKKTLKMIFLVGDAPPHMDYTDDVKYPETCKKAVENNLIINTIQCGNRDDCAKAWKDIAIKSEGSYVAIAQDGGVKAVSTPFDKELAQLNTDLTKTVLVYGKQEQQDADRRKNTESLKLDAESASSRVAYQARNRQAAAYCLLSQIEQGKVKLEDIKKEELPEELKKLSLKEQKEYLAKLQKQREELSKRVLELDKKRNEHIAKEKDKQKDGFDGQVLEVLRNQAKKYDIKY